MKIKIIISILIFTFFILWIFRGKILTRNYRAKEWKSMYSGKVKRMHKKKDEKNYMIVYENKDSAQIFFMN